MSKLQHLSLRTPSAVHTDWLQWHHGLQQAYWFRELDSAVDSIPGWQIFKLYKAMLQKGLLVQHIGNQCEQLPPELRS